MWNWVKKTFFFVQENNLEWQQKCKYFFFLHVRGKKIWGEFIKNSVCVKPIKETFRRFYFMCETDWIEHFSWKTSQKFYLEIFFLIISCKISENLSNLFESEKAFVGRKHFKCEISRLVFASCEWKTIKQILLIFFFM